jgi:hypothetical protein
MHRLRRINPFRAVSLSHIPRRFPVTYCTYYCSALSIICERPRRLRYRGPFRGTSHTLCISSRMIHMFRWRCRKSDNACIYLAQSHRTGLWCGTRYKIQARKGGDQYERCKLGQDNERERPAENPRTRQRNYRSRSMSEERREMRAALTVVVCGK